MLFRSYFAARKNVLEYDDVMNLQRTAIYEERNAILDGKDMSDRIPGIIADAAARAVEETCPVKLPSDDWDTEALDSWVHTMTGRSDFSTADVDHDDDAELLADAVQEYLEGVYAEKTEVVGEGVMKALESQVMLRIIDTRWMAHLHDMDYLRTGIGLRSLGQRDPLTEYREEAYRAFESLTENMYDDYLRTLLRLQVAERQAPVMAEVPDPLARKVSYSNPEQALAAPSSAAAPPRQVSAVPAPQAKPQTYMKDKNDPFSNVGRNDPCPCGSGKKYKKCCGRNAE